MVFVSLLPPLVLAAGAALFGMNRLTRIRDAWTAAGGELGLQVVLGNRFTMPRLEGGVRDVRVAVKVRKGGDNDSNYTRYEVRHRPVGPVVSLKRQGALSRIAKFFGKRDVQIGDPFFDDRVVVDSAHPGAIRDFLTPARQVVILEVFDRWRNGEVTHDSIVVETSKVETNADTLVATVRRLLDMAAVLGDPAALNAALSKQQDGSIAEATAALRAMNEAQPNIFTETLEAEALIELGDHEQAAAVFERVGERLPAPAAAPGGWETLASTPSPVSLPAAPLAARPVGASQQQVIDDLFDAGRLSYEIVEQFERRYANTLVTWRGTVTRVSSYRRDPDFGDGPGVKATVLLGGSGRSLLVSNEVHATVQLPDGVTIERDTDIAFTGTLVRVDRFARMFYVERAEPA